MEVVIGPQDTYKITLTDSNDKTYQIEKSFTQLRELSQGLKVSHPQIPLLSFPTNPKEVTHDILLEYLQAFKKSGIIEADLFFEVHANIPREVKPKILVPLPDNDFDPSEVGIPWKLMTQSGFEITFASERGGEGKEEKEGKEGRKLPKADELLTREEGVIFGQLGADKLAKQYYFEMEQSASFQNPIKWADINPSDYDGLLLGGGHAPRMKQYLESEILQEKISQFWELNRPVGAICHGVLLLARTKKEGESVLKGRKTTSLPKYMEQMAYGLTFWKYGRLYRTYDVYCQTEIESFLATPSDFLVGPTTLGSRGSLYDDSNTFVIEDGNYISSRWPGDAFAFGKKFITKINQSIAKKETE